MQEVPEKLTKPYNPAETEGRIYDMWEKSGHFAPEGEGEPFCIVLPPPNVTGTLHLGHEEFLNRVTKFAKESHDTIVSQVRRMGASLDLSREFFTLDETRSKAVVETFNRMREAGLIYQGNKIVNWDPKGQTVISDDEIVHEERMAKLYTFKYTPDFPIAISTTRPETKVGDVAVAVHPDDTRYKEFIGQDFANIAFAGATLNIKIVASEEVDPNFGTGALGVTPAHSVVDWEIAESNKIGRAH